MKNIYSELKMAVSMQYDIAHSTANRCNKLIKIKLSTEDEKVHNYIDNLIVHINEAKRLHYKRLYTSSSKEFKKIKELNDEIAEYCDKMLSKGKPEWMILAERNGWTPPKEVKNE